MAGSHYVIGQWNALCGECGRQYKSAALRKRWDGWMVCPDCWEIRNPQDFVRGVPDRQNVPWSQNPPDLFVGVGPASNRVLDGAALDSISMG